MDFFKSGKEKPVENKNKNQKSGGFFGQEANANAAPAAGQAQQPAQRIYTVKSGDSLSKIAKQYYGDAQQWKRIHQANLDQIKDPNLIHPGQKLVIPQ
jgi:nucleoid-associated protein YgaU